MEKSKYLDISTEFGKVSGAKASPEELNNARVEILDWYGGIKTRKIQLQMPLSEITRIQSDIIFNKTF